MHLRFTLSFRGVEELLAERGIVVTYESIRRWVLTFGPTISCRLRARRPKSHGRWHLDEMCVRVGGRQMYLWRAVDAEGEVLDVLLQAKRDTRAVRKLMRKLLKRQGMVPEEWVGQEPGLWRCASRAQASQGASDSEQAGGQPSGEFARSGTTTRAKAARVQVTEVCPAVLVPPCGHLQRLHRSPSSHLGSHLPAAQGGGVGDVARGGWWSASDMGSGTASRRHVQQVDKAQHTITQRNKHLRSEELCHASRRCATLLRADSIYIARSPAMFCSACGAQIGENARFCHKCGHRREAPTEAPIARPAKLFRTLLADSIEGARVKERLAGATRKGTDAVIKVSRASSKFAILRPLLQRHR